MDKLLLTYTHLIATCLALGLIVTADMRLLAKMVRYRCIIRPPRHFETQVIATALIVLCASGGGLVAIGVVTTPQYLDNPKLQAKLLLVAALCANAFVLHRITFPRLAKPHRVSTWTLHDQLRVVLPVALSNTLWLYCAFLGVARSWNNTRPVHEVLLIAAVLYLLTAAAIFVALRVAARDEPHTPPDWIDSMKARLSDHAPLSGYRAPFHDSQQPGPG